MHSINALTRILLTGSLVLFCSTMAFAQDKNDKTRMLFDFKDAKVAKTWRTVNDTVMGGVSEGEVRITKDKTLEFYGDLSLKNNGGFTSARSQPGKLDLSEFDALLFKVRGDGRAYYANIYVPTRRIAYSYRAEFQTHKTKWQEIRIPLQDFYATSFGRKVQNAPPLDTSNIQSVGFLLSDKKAGPFNLEIAWIKGETY